MYLRMADSWYSLVTVLDADIRYVGHWDLLTAMAASDVRVVMQEALERTGATPDLVTDNGSQFTAADFQELVRRFAFRHLRIWMYHRESNGAVERFHRTTREALAETVIRNLGQARALLAEWVRSDNEERRHAALGYLPPSEYSRGHPAARVTARSETLERVREHRQTMNQQRQQAAQATSSYG